MVESRYNVLALALNSFDNMIRGSSPFVQTR